MLRSGSKRMDTRYVPVIRDGKEIVWQGEFMCGNRDVSTPFNHGASDIAALVLQAVVDPNEMKRLIEQPIPSAAWNCGRGFGAADWNRLQQRRAWALEMAEQMPEKVRARIQGVVAGRAG